MKPSHAVHEAIDTLRRQGADHTAAHHTYHAIKGPCRVDGQEDVVQYNESVEEASLAEGPRLLASGGVVAVEQLSSHGIDCGDSQWDLGVKSGSVDVVRDQDRRCR